MDLALVCSENGFDLQLVGNDLALVFGTENMVALGMFGGNIEESTVNNIVNEQSFDWWGNNLLMPSDQTSQFNSIVEKTLNNTPLTSNGRIEIQNAIISDLAFFTPINGSAVQVTVTIESTDRISVQLQYKQASGIKVTIINFRKQSDGDFYIFDFNDDFYL